MIYSACFVKVMKNISSEFRLFYVSQVLGVKSYLCPRPLYKSRSLTGGLPHSVVAVVFRPLSLDQRVLLKKIFAAVEVFSFSLLEIKEGWRDSIAISNAGFSGLKGVFVFGKGPETPKPNSLSQGEESAFKSLIKNSFQRKALAEGAGRGSSAGALPDPRPPCFFYGPLSDYEGGHSPLVAKRKQELWERLKQWKKALSG